MVIQNTYINNRIKNPQTIRFLDFINFLGRLPAFPTFLVLKHPAERILAEYILAEYILAGVKLQRVTFVLIQIDDGRSRFKPV